MFFIKLFHAAVPKAIHENKIERDRNQFADLPDSEAKDTNTTNTVLQKHSTTSHTDLWISLGRSELLSLIPLPSPTRNTLQQTMLLQAASNGHDQTADEQSDLESV